MTVGQGFGEFNPHAVRRTIRMPVNPMDRCTIVSTYPREIFTNNPTLIPRTFFVPAVPEDGFEISVITPASWFKEMEEGQPYLEIPNSSIQVAESIIRDYSNGLVGCNMGDCMPGLFFVPGEYNKISILGYVSPDKKPFKQLIHESNVKQNNWFMELVRMADVDWARTNGNPRAISDLSRLAATRLHLTNKSWLQDFKTIELINCRACGHLVNPNYPVCSNCKNVIDEKKAKELGLVFAK